MTYWAKGQVRKRNVRGERTDKKEMQASPEFLGTLTLTLILSESVRVMIP